VICECRHTREVCGSRVWPGDPRAAAGVLCLAGAGPADGPCGVLPGGTGEVGGDDIGSVPVQAAAGTVIPHRGPGIGVRGGLLDVAERNPGVEGGGEERMPQRVRPNWLGDFGASSACGRTPRCAAVPASRALGATRLRSRSQGRVGGAGHQYKVVTVSRNPEIVPNPPTVKALSETMWSRTIWRGSTPG
jgi:hypothetical protein